MEIKTAIEVQAYADYDVIYTKCIMVSPDVRNVRDILNTFCISSGLPEPDGTGLPENMLSDTTDEFIKYLKKEGFTSLKRTEVIFTD